MRKYFEQWASIFPWFVNKPLDCEENGKYLSDLGYDDHDSQILYEGFKAGVDYSRKHTSPKGYVPKWDGKCSDCGKEGHIRCGDFGIISPGGGNPSQNTFGIPLGTPACPNHPFKYDPACATCYQLSTKT